MDSAAVPVPSVNSGRACNALRPAEPQFLGQVRGFFFQKGFDWSLAGHGGLGLLYGMVQQQAALISFTEVFRVMGFLFLATVPLVLLMRKARQRGANPVD